MGEPYFACMATVICFEKTMRCIIEVAKIFGDAFLPKSLVISFFRRIFAEELIKGENYGV